jgi:galactokinase
MISQSTSFVLSPRLADNMQSFQTAHPVVDGFAVSVRAPAVADVMGGIAEESGAPVLTATLSMSFAVSMWRIAGDSIRLRLIPEGGEGSAHDFSAALSVLAVPVEQSAAIVDVCKKVGADWAASACLTVQRALSQAIVTRPTGGWAILLQTDFPAEVDLGRHTVVAAGVMEALTRLEKKVTDRATKARLCSDAASVITGLQSVRTALTSLSGAADGSLLQIQFHPQPTGEAVALPVGSMIVALRTSLARPVTQERLIDTRLCAEMGQRIILGYHGGDGQPGSPRLERLSSITPDEFVERFKDIFPQKITGKQYTAKFGELRGLNGHLAPDDVYKVRSRAEHHIYENRRVHEFSNCISRARRSNSLEAMIAAGGLMYSSHWSHSQRCGIGGVETDRLVTCIRKYGPAAGLFGAKVTCGGSGGEMVVLMRDDAATHAALAKAVAEAQSLSNRSIRTFRGSLAGAELATV